MPRALRNILVVLLALILAVGAGAFIYFETRTSAPVAGFEAATETRLAGSAALALDDIASIEIAARASGFELARRDGAWVVASHDDYPVDGEAVRDLIAQLAGTGVLYHRPAKGPELASYGLRPLTDASSNARRVTLRGPDGTARLTLRIGFVVDLPGGSERETMVMVPAENRILAVDRPLQVPTALSAWFAGPPLDIAATDVTEIAVRAAPDAPTHRFLRGEAGGWTRRLPDGSTETVPSPGPLDSVASAAANFAFVDARRGRTFSTPEYAAPYRLGLTLADGTHLTFRLRVGESDTWLRLVEATARCPAESASCPASERAAAISESMTGWAYRLPISRAAQFHVLPGSVLE